MKFYDRVRLELQSGKGGNGCVSARREAGVPYGGPNGGNGGNGGSIIFRCDSSVNTLLHLRYHKIYKAQDGNPGKGKDQYGANAEDTYISLPIGSLIKDTNDGHILWQAQKYGDEWVALAGAKGGAGNMHFKNSVVQYPDFALLGEPSQRLEVDIEMLLLGDVGLIGYPSVGKSSIINAICNTQVKVADYPFTTLVPNLGSVKYKDIDRNIVDIPGIISGASSGKGLGLDFLRHILKAKIFHFVLDISRRDDGILEFGKLWNELMIYMSQQRDMSHYHISVSFDHDNILLQVLDFDRTIILEKIIYIVVNKIDECEDVEVLDMYRDKLNQHIYDTIYKYIDKKDNINISNIVGFIKNNTIYTSAVLGQNMSDYIASIYKKIKNNSLHNSRIEYDISHYYHEKSPYILDITDRFEDIDMLVAQGIVQPEELDNPDDETHMREIYDPKLTTLVFQIMRGKDLAEQWFWKTINTMGYIRRFHKHKIKSGDILKFKSIYDARDDIYVRYWISK